MCVYQYPIDTIPYKTISVVRSLDNSFQQGYYQCSKHSRYLCNISLYRQLIIANCSSSNLQGLGKSHT